MTEINIIIPAVTAFLAAALTLMTGFGLGTILTPVFLLFYDVKIAILIVAVVHLLNNLLKFSLFSRHINTEILKRFGILTITGAFIGAFLQGMMNSGAVKVLLGISPELQYPEGDFYSHGYYHRIRSGYYKNTSLHIQRQRHPCR